jgi:hypothetical protein
MLRTARIHTLIPAYLLPPTLGMARCGMAVCRRPIDGGGAEYAIGPAIPSHTFTIGALLAAAVLWHMVWALHHDTH